MISKLFLMVTSLRCYSHQVALIAPTQAPDSQSKQSQKSSKVQVTMQGPPQTITPPKLTSKTDLNELLGETDGPSKPGRPRGDPMLTPQMAATTLKTKIQTQTTTQSCLQKMRMPQTLRRMKDAGDAREGPGDSSGRGEIGKESQGGRRSSLTSKRVRLLSRISNSLLRLKVRLIKLRFRHRSSRLSLQTR